MYYPGVIAILLAWGLSIPAASTQPRTSGHAEVSGLVVDADSRRPLTDAHVFIASSMIGAVTDADGRYLLRRIPAGGHVLYVSMLGYEPARIDTVLRAGASYEITAELRPAVLDGPEIVVVAERDRAWYRRLDRFKRLFIGESPYAAQCEIENPEVLSFETKWWGDLSAQAREPLVITNRALGYRITYFLKEFEATSSRIRWDGEPFFEMLDPPDSARAEAWREARRKAYYGSFRHFMQSILLDSYREEGFVAHRRYNLDGGLAHGQHFLFKPQHILKEAPEPEEVILDFHGFVEVVYVHEPADDEFLRWQYGNTWHHRREQRSLFSLTDGPTRVDALGEVIDPYGVTVYGYFAYKRVGDLVPKEFVP
jgi:hypothetical protein